MTIARYTVRGRSIDGRVHASGFTGWTLGNALSVRAVTARQCQMIVAEQRARNARSEADSIVGRLSIVPRSRTLARIIQRHKESES